MKHTLIPMITMCALYGATLTSCGDRNSAATSPTETREILVAVSPNLSDKCRETVWSSLGELVLQGTQPGDVVKVYDGLALNQIASLRIPNEEVMLNNPQARTTRLAKELKSLRAFLEEPKQAVADDGALLVPQFVELIATQPHKSRRTSILLIGSPVYDYAKDPVWSFADQRYPSDAHLAVDQFRSTFGCKGREQWLTGVSVYQFFPNEQVFTIESHRLAVTRFWRRWFRAMGASPGIACGDIKSVMDAVPADAANDALAATDETRADVDDDKVMMLTAQKPQPDSREDAWIVDDSPPVVEPPIQTTRVLSDDLPVAPRSPMVKDLRVGIRWDAAVDLDLYVRPRSDAEELYYGRGRTPDGLHEKDFAAVPAGVANGFETVRFNHPVDVREVSAALNLYRGKVPNGCDCEVRVFADGEVFSRTIHIAAEIGTRGNTGGTRAADPAWGLINLAEIIGVEPGGSTAENTAVP